MSLPLAPCHMRRNARMTDFHGYFLPLSFTSILEEAKAVREKAGLFDISHMGHFMATGPGVRRHLNGLITSDLEAVPPGKCLYALLPNDQGGTVDDLILAASGEDEIHVIVNAGNRDGDFAWLRDHLPKSISLEDLSAGQIGLALQGPASSQIVSLLARGFEGMKRREARFSMGAANHLWISRTGYTGEDGWEFFGSEESILPLYRILSEKGGDLGLHQAGLGARDLLRLEMAYPLYGQELTPEKTAFDAGLDFAVNLRKGSFLGKDKMLEKRAETGRNRLTGFVLTERGIPRTHCPVLDPATGLQVGEVTSGGHSPRVGGGFGLAYMEPGFLSEFEQGKEAGVEIHGKIHRARIHERPFVTGGLSGKKESAQLAVKSNGTADQGAKR